MVSLASIIGCSYKKENRYQDCNEMFAAIEAIEGDLPEIPEDHPPLAMPPKDTHETQVPDMPSGSGISVETFDSSLASSTSPGGERQRTDPFGQFQPGASSSFSNDYSQPDTTDSGATFFPMDMDDGPIHETVAPAPHPANSEAPTTVAPPKSNTGLFLGIGLVVLLLLGGGAFVMMGQGDSQPSPELAASALVAAQLEANASIKAEKAEKNTIEILKKVEQAAVITEQPDPPTAKAVTEVKQVREEVESQLDEVTEVADESREELKRVVQTSPELQENRSSNLGQSRQSRGRGTGAVD